MAAEKSVGSVKIVGYLEKKGKLKFVNTWKKYWFVLEGRLLLYYRSQEEYDNLSPCKGSITIGLASNIRPGLATAGVFQIITRTNTVTLRAKERSIQEKWLQALLDATGQQTATNPIKMSHFRYSMDDLIPTGAKQKQQNQIQVPVLARQNTLPHHFKIDQRNSIIDRIRLIGGQTYGGSLTTINQLSKTKNLLGKPINQEDKKQQHTMSGKSLVTPESDHENEMLQNNDLYAGIFIENTQYISANDLRNNGTDAKNDFDHNKNCYIIENDHYIKSDSVSLKNDGSSTTQSETSRPEDIEYYCTYEEVLSQTNNGNLSGNIYSEPDFLPRPEEKLCELEVSSCSKDEKKKSSKFLRFAKRLKNLKSEENSLKKRSASLIMKVIGKKKSNEQIIVEPIYDTVDYLQIENIAPENPDKENLVKTLIDLQHTLETRKSQIKEMIESTTSSPTAKEDEPVADDEKRKSEERNDNNNIQPVICNPPGLPPRRVSRPRSPFHDIPKNNTPVKQFLLDTSETPKQTDYTIDQILDDLEMESKKTDAKQTEELSVKQLIKKFNHSTFDIDGLSVATEQGAVDVLMRQKSDNCNSDSNKLMEYAALNLNADNRHSDELNKLLEELTKVTSAPLMTPGVTSSLVQIKSKPLTDEEWLAIPIRRRRHSEPDYDVPRPHRSLQILPQSPSDENNEDESVIPATRFFGPVLPPSISHDKSYIESMSWRSMTPDSLEPLQQIQAAMKQQRRNELVAARSDAENERRISYEKTINDHLKDIPSNNMEELGIGVIQNDLVADVADKCQIVDKPNDFKSNDNFLDSLEPFNESATAF